jgi:HD-like signal output (HDOD) protein
MKRILIVEGSAVMRELFRNMLATERGRWEVATAASGEAALELMSERPFDAVITDMRMDGMGGLELLNEVLRLYPQTSRIILSGAADQAVAAEALGSTHQFIVKPVGPKTLKAALSHLESLDAFLQDENLKRLAGRLRALPSFPMLYLEIRKAIDAPETSLQTINSLVTQDPGLTAKILQLANSAAFWSREKLSDPLEAVQQLGFNRLSSLALSAHVFGSYTPSWKINFPVDSLWTHLMQCANTARAIMRAESADAVSADAAYTAGLLHDIGKLMLADGLPGEYQSALTLAAQRNASLFEIEAEVFGATHAGVAAYLLGLWGLPAPIVEAVAFHHTPGQSALQAFGPLTAVHAANALEHELDGEPHCLNEDYLARLGVAGRLDAWREEARKSRANP